MAICYLLRHVSVIRKAQFSPRVWIFLKSRGKTKENARKTKDNLRNRGSKFLIRYFFEAELAPPPPGGRTAPLHEIEAELAPPPPGGRTPPLHEISRKNQGKYKKN